MKKRNEEPETIDAAALDQVAGGAGWGDAVDNALGAGFGFGGRYISSWLRGGNQTTSGGAHGPTQ